jgi:hypothetical protein
VILLLNGAFGIGKTTVARSLMRRLPHSAIFDPELIGVAMQRAARLARSKTNDFQDFPLWRILTVTGLRALRAFRPTIIVPMAFSNTAYLGEIRAKLSRFEPCVLHICLVAPVEVVHARLRSRGAHPARHSWQYRRAAECCAVHGQADFSEQIPTANRPVEDVVNEVLAAMRGAERPARA